VRREYLSELAQAGLPILRVMGRLKTRFFGPASFLRAFRSIPWFISWFWIQITHYRQRMNLVS